jgi:hypothetical protein
MATEVEMIAGLILAAAVQAGAAKAPVFRSRVAYAPLLSRLEAAGEAISRVLHPSGVEDLAALETGKRYKFAVPRDGSIAIAPLPADAPRNEYVHPILAGGGAVRTAGGIRIDRVRSSITSITLDQDSQAYCPSFSSLGQAARALEALGVPARAIHMENRPPTCVSPR